MVFILTVVVLQSISFANYALTTTTTNIIYGSAPYLTFDGGRTRVTNTEALLGISLSDGRTFTPTTNNSSDNPIILPVIGQSFADIGMLVPTDTNSIALSSLIGTPYNYWGDDDGDGQGVNGVTATGSLNLSIVDKFNNPVARNEVLTICKAPYKLTLSNGEGRLTTRYGVPNESRFTAGNATYYINPKAAPAICYARPSLAFGTANTAPADIWDPRKGFLTQSFTPSSYGSNFPTTGAHNLYFDLDIVGNNQALSWAPVSHGGITATMTDSPYPYNNYSSVRVTLTGPFAISYHVDNPVRIAIPSLPQTFELVGRDSSGNAVVKYGFELKQWFVHRGPNVYAYSERWCNGLGGYRIPNAKELTNASCKDSYGREGLEKCRDRDADRPISPYDTLASRHIGGGLFSEWGRMKNYYGAGFVDNDSDISGYFAQGFVVVGDHWFMNIVNAFNGRIYRAFANCQGICVYP
ncbi:hypothetical protein [Gilliamella apicola]|uniref:hypothetical protein n=1 Tax=Gilliamella apicola TaxID=1196095 RepID=UPI00080F44CA|nr:hypothetical protein [Gilliamella apis]OCF99947.1 hypothetical protein A9G16_02875 [Gilliamella apis]